MRNSRKKATKKWMGRLGSMLLSLALVLTGMPLQALAEGTDVVTVNLEAERMELPTLETSAPAISMFALSNGNVALKEGNHTKWIDRLDLTGADYASDFYDWLVANSDLNSAAAADTTSALVDPTKGTLLSGDYVYPVKTFTGTAYFTPTNDANADAAAASSAASEVINANYNEAAAYITAVFSAFDRDHPEVFWLSGRSMTSSPASISYSSNGTVEYTQTVYFILQSAEDNFDIRATEYQNADTIKSAINSTFLADGNAVSTILGGLQASATTYDKVKHFNQWLTTNNCYNGDVNTAGHLARESVGALTSADGTSAPVCEAYARAFKVLCDKAGIPCVLVDGTATNSSGSEAHMWNYVQMEDNNWYAVDVTWNDPTVSGVTGDVSGYEREDYLLVGSTTNVGGMAFIQSHPVSNTVTMNGVAFTNGPVLAENAYVYEIPKREIFFDNSVAEWSTIYAYFWNSADIANQLTTWPGELMTAAVDGTHYSTMIPVSADYIIFNNGSNTQTSDITIGDKNCLKITSASGDYIWYSYPCTHADVDCSDNGDGTHKKVCGDCGEVLLASENHSGGTATCKTQASCLGCGVGYGALADHNYVNYKCTVCGVGDPALVASVKVNDTFTYYTSFQDAIDYVTSQEDCTLFLHKHVTSETGFLIEGNDVGLNLNGMTITVNGDTDENALTVKGDLSIYDSVGNGKIVRNGGNGSVIYVDGGNVEFNGVTLEGHCSHAVTLKNNGNFHFISGIISNDGYAVEVYEGATFILSGGYDIRVGDGFEEIALDDGSIKVNKAPASPISVYTIDLGKIATATEGVVMQEDWFEVYAGVYGMLTPVIRNNEFWAVYVLEDNNCRITVDSEADLIYTGSEMKPGITVEMQYPNNGIWEELAEGTDYTISYTNHVDAGTATVTITGICGFDGTKSTTFTIEPRTITTPYFSELAPIYAYTGSAVTPAFVLMDDLGNVIPESEYTVSYSDNTAVGNATIRIADKANGNYTVSGSATFAIAEHVHDWKYTVSGDVITASCEGVVGTCPVGTATVTFRAPESLGFDGSAKAALVDGVIDGVETPAIVYTAAEGSSLTNGQAIHAGTYTASVTFGEGGDAVTASVTFEITKKTIDSVSFSIDEPVAGATPMTSLYNNGMAYAPAVRWSPVAETFDYNTVYTVTAVLTAMRSHQFAGTVSQDGWEVSFNEDYTVATFTRTFEATGKRKITGITAPTFTTFTTYKEDTDAAIAALPTAVAIALEAGGTDTLAITWSCENYDATPEAVNTFTWTADNTEYDVDNVTLTGTVTVTNADALAVNHTGTDKEIAYGSSTYDVAQMFTVDSNAGEASYEILSVGNSNVPGTLNGSVLTINGIGEITIRLSTAAKGAYAAGEATAVLTINKGNVTLSTTPAPVAGLTYSQSARELVSGGTAVNGTLMYYVGRDGSDVNAVNYESVVPTATDVGTYTVWYYVKGNENYDDTTPTSVNVTIGKATPDVVQVPTVAERVYSPSVALVDGDLVEGTVLGADGNPLAGYWKWQREGVVPTANNNGYEAVFIPEDVTNYNTVTGLVVVSVAKATPTISSVEASTVDDSTDISAVTLTCQGATVPGTIVLTDNILQYGTHTYNWKYTPDAGYIDNYKELTGTVSITVKDTKVPTATYQIGTEAVKECGSISTAFLKDFYGADQTVSIGYSDQGSGVATKQYYVSAEILDNTDNVVWKDYTEAITLGKGVHYIYVRVTDVFGNESILVSKGILIYEESTIDTDTIAYTYKENRDCVLQIAWNGNTFEKLTDGADVEIAADAYAIDSTGKLTLKKAYLDMLDKGVYTYKIYMKPQDVETTAFTLCYVFTVDVGARELAVVEATAASRDYNGSAAVLVTALTLNGVVAGDDVAVSGSALQGTLSSANAGTYTSVTLPTLTLTGADAGNYILAQSASAVPLSTDVVIRPLHGEITVGTAAYTKTYGDVEFALNVTDNSPESAVQYAVTAGNDVVSVSADGRVTILKAGEAIITVSMTSSTNYSAAESKTITVHVEKKSGYVLDVINKKYLYERENEDSIDLSKLIPQDCGNVNYMISNVSESTAFSVAPAISNGVLSYKVAAGQIGDEAEVIIAIVTDNYENFTVQIRVALVDKTPVSLKDGTEVSLKNAVLTYGGALSELEFEDAIFVTDDGTEVPGTLAWNDASVKPAVGTTSATWIFTPQSEVYMTLEGTVAITINKAVPNVTAVPTVATRVYHPTKALTAGDLAGGEVIGVDGNALAGIWNWQITSTIPTVGNVGYAAVFTPNDTSNYKTVTKTIQVAVTPATPAVVTKPVASALVYGNALEASTLSGGTVQYSGSDNAVIAGSFAWKDGAVKPTVADSNLTAYAVVFTPVDITNYKTVETTIVLTVEKAENVPNMPQVTISTPYDSETVADVTLPDGWVWQETDKEKLLAIGVAVNATAVYVGDDAENYENVAVVIAITRSACEHGDTEVRDEMPATCVKAGYTGDTYCKDCGVKIASGSAVDKLPHSYASAITKEPTEAEEGVRTYTCTKCKHSYTEAIAKLEPEEDDTWEDTDQKAPQSGNVDVAPVIHVVKSGDTLWALARQYGCTIKEIVEANSGLIRDADMIHVGWSLTIPQKGADGGIGGTGAGTTGDKGTQTALRPQLYVVQSGDNLWKIARKYGCTVKDIVLLNQELIHDPELIYAGWELKIPQE